MKSREIDISSDIKKYEGEIKALENITELNQELKFAFLLRDDVIISELMTQYSSVVGKIDTNKDLFGDQHPVQRNYLKKVSINSINHRPIRTIVGERLSIEIVNNISKLIQQKMLVAMQLLH